MSKQPRYKQFGLEQGATRKDSRSFLDFDYVHKLSAADRDYLARFSAEYYQETFTNTDKDLAKKDTDERRRIQTARNARRRDVWNNFQRNFQDPSDSAEQENKEECE